METLLYLYIGFSLLLVLISIPLILRKVKPNPLYGFRIRQTLDDPEVWYRVNEYFARHLFFIGILQVITSIAFSLIPGIGVDAYALLCLAVFVILFTRAMLLSFRYIKSLN